MISKAEPPIFGRFKSNPVPGMRWCLCTQLGTKGKPSRGERSTYFVRTCYTTEPDYFKYVLLMVLNDAFPSKRL